MNRLETEKFYGRAAKRDEGQLHKLYYLAILKLPLLNRRMSDKESAELKTIGGTLMVNFVQKNCPHGKKNNQNLTRELQSLPLGLTWREKRAGIRKPKR